MTLYTMLGQLKDSGRAAMLVTIRDELYGGSWDVMRQEVEGAGMRREMTHTMQRQAEGDLELIAVLRRHEEAGVDLREFAAGILQPQSA